MQTTFLRPPGAAALVAFFVSASSLQGAAFSGTAYDGFDYAAGNMANPTTTPASALTGGIGWNGNGASGGSGTATTWGITLGGNNTTAVTTNPRFGLNASNATVASANQQILATGLSYPGLASSGGAVQIGNVSTTASVGRNFGQNIDSGTFYFSYLVQKTAVNTLRTANVGFFGLVDATTAPVERVSIGQIGSNTNYMGADGVNNASTTVPPANQGDFQVLNSNPLAASSSVYKTAAIFGRNATTVPNSVAAQPMTLNTTYMVLGKFEFNVGANTTDDRLTLYLNPTDLSVENPANAYFSVTGVDFGTLTGFRMFTGSTGTAGFEAPTAIYDEFRFGTSFGDVVVAVPEPTTAALGGLGMLGIFLRRRRA